MHWHSRRALLGLLCVLSFRLLSAATDPPQCTSRAPTLKEVLLGPGISRKATQCQQITFPTNNRLLHINGKQLAVVVADHKTQPSPPPADTAGAAVAPTAALFFFYASWCPFSNALWPVLACLPRFFSPDITFLAVDETSPTKSGLLHWGVHSFPSIKLYVGQQHYHHTGERTLQSLVDFVANKTELAPLAGPNATELCSADENGCWCKSDAQAAIVTSRAILESRYNRWLAASTLFLAVLATQYGIGQYKARKAAAMAPVPGQDAPQQVLPAEQ